MIATVEGTNISLEVQPRSDNFWHLFQSGAWEPWTLGVLVERLTPGSRYVDIGAWVGPTVLVAAACGATVDGFEPDPTALSELRANLAANPDLVKLVTIHPVALSATSGQGRLSGWRALGKGMSSLAHSSGEGVTVQVEAVSSWLDQPAFLHADIVKIDIEGGEYELLTMMRRYITTHRPDLLLSLHAYHLYGRAPWYAHGVVVPFVRNRVLAQRERLKLAWLAKVYPYVYVIDRREWNLVRKATWHRLLHVPRNFEFFFSATPLRRRNLPDPRPLKPWRIWLA